tara:strand:+ start:6033 stop:6758 length:726 start_codon:yes stop_codon:yes gene_type:complete
MGLFADYIYKKNKDVILYLVDPITEGLSTFKNNPNFKIIDKVITNNYDPLSEIKYNIYENSALASMFEIKDNNDLDKVWKPYKEDIKNHKTISVNTETLKNIISKDSIDEISFVKIDAQGEDLNVLLSAGNMLERINSCVMEISYEKELSLYKEEISLEESIEKIFELGFVPFRIVPNGGGECNIFIYNKNFGLDKYMELEKKYDFRNAPTLKLNNMSMYHDLVTIKDLAGGLKRYFKKFI